MNFESPSPRRDRGEPVAPLINVVFLLLIFFLMAATLAPPDPLEATPPTSESGEAARINEAVVIDAAGTIAFGAFRGDSALQAVADRLREDPDFVVMVRADQRASAATAAQTLKQLQALGARNAALVVTP